MLEETAIRRWGWPAGMSTDIGVILFNHLVSGSKPARRMLTGGYMSRV